MSNICSGAPKSNFLVLSTLFAGLLFLMISLAAQAQTINELSYTGGWGDTIFQGIQGAANSGLTAFATPNNQIHTVYRGLDQHIHQLHSTGSGTWQVEDLTAETNAPAPQESTIVTGFSQQNLQYVFYADVNNHLHQLMYNNVRWTDQDITAAGNGVTWSTYDYCLAAVSTTPNNQIHVYYGGTDSNTHQLFFNGSRWSDENLTAETNAGQSSSAMVAVSNGNYQYVFYEGPTADIHEMYYNNARWTDVNLTASAGAGYGDYGNLAALIVPGTQTIKLYYGEYSDEDMLELTTSNNVNWTKLDLTKTAHGAAVDGTMTLGVAFATTPNNQLHVYYGVSAYGTDADVHQLYFNGNVWSDEDLSTETHSAGVYFNSGMAGFAIGNAQYVFYGQ
jgi:hypothetical protein